MHDSWLKQADESVLPQSVCFEAHRSTVPLLPLQVLLLLVALVAVPWMLIPKPYILKKRHEARQSQVPCSQHQAPVHTSCACACYLLWRLNPRHSFHKLHCRAPRLSPPWL